MNRYVAPHLRHTKPAQRQVTLKPKVQAPPPKASGRKWAKLAAGAMSLTAIATQASAEQASEGFSSSAIDLVTTQLAQGAQDVATARTLLDQAQRSLDKGSQALQGAHHPQKMAATDDEHTDVSRYGRELQSAFNNGSRSLQKTDSQISDTNKPLKNGQSKLELATRVLTQAITESKPSDPRLPQLKSALDDLKNSQRNLTNMQLSPGRLSSRLDSADIHLKQIAYDSPGEDVSSHAILVGDTLRKVESQLPHLNGSLSHANQQGQLAEQNLSKALNTLKNLP